MPVVKKLSVRSRVAVLLRRSPGKVYTMTALSAALECDLSILPAHCRSLAETCPDIWYLVPASPGVAASVVCSAAPPEEQ